MPKQALQELADSIKKEVKKMCKELKPVILHEAYKQIDELKVNNYKEEVLINNTRIPNINPPDMMPFNYRKTGLYISTMSYKILTSLFDNAFVVKTDVVNDPLITLVSSQKERIQYNHMIKEINQILCKEFSDKEELLLTIQLVGYNQDKSSVFLLVQPDSIKEEKEKRFKRKKIIAISSILLVLSLFFHLF